MKALLEAFDLASANQAAEIIQHPPNGVFKELRTYLLREAEQNSHQTKQHEIAKLLRQGNGHEGVIFLGPSFDKGESSSGSFLFGSGGSLSFGLVLKESGGKSILESARFHFKSKSERWFSEW